MELLIRITVIAVIALLAFAASSNLPAEPVPVAATAPGHGTTVPPSADSSNDRGIAHETGSRAGPTEGESLTQANDSRATPAEKDRQTARKMPLRAVAVAFLSLIALVAIARRGVSEQPERVEHEHGRTDAGDSLVKLMRHSASKRAEHAENSTR